MGKDIYRDINKAVMEISWRAINIAGLANGAAATAVLARGAVLPALFFAFGLVSALVSFGLAYCTNLALLEKLKPEHDRETYKIFPVEKLTIKAENAENLRKYAFFSWFYAILFFIIGIFTAFIFLK